MASRSALFDYLRLDLDCHLPGGLRGFEIDRLDFSCLEPVGCTVQQYAAGSLLRSIVKKFQDEIDQHAADKAAFDLFIAMNNRCKEVDFEESELGPYDEVIVGEFSQAMYDFFNPEGFPLLDTACIFGGADFGPGSAPGARATSFLDKIGHSTLTAGSQFIADLYDLWLRENPLRVDAELCRLLSVGPLELIEAVEITPVPKTAKISRLVKPEPLLNMFFQKGVQKVLEDRLRSFFGIDLTVQPARNSELARKGSVDGSYATIDLSSASDCLSLKLCEKFIPRASFTWLNKLRSRKAILPGYDEPVNLHMMCTMGNAFCFPLQTVIFACVVKAVYRSLGLPFRRESKGVLYTHSSHSGDPCETLEMVTYPANWGVFGDDIVVHEDAYRATCRILRYLGFIPNQEKSFDKMSGPFRESCGSDWFFGSNVRGIYCKSLKRMQDVYVLINSLVEWSARWGIELPLTIGFLLEKVRYIEIPPWENPDAGIRVPLCCVKTNRVFRAIRPDRHGRHYQGSYLYKRYVPENDSIDVSNGRSVCGTYWNSSAVFISAVKGCLRGGKVSLRMWETPYKLRIGVAPSWDFAVPGTNLYKVWVQWKLCAMGYFLGA